MIAMGNITNKTLSSEINLLKEKVVASADLSNSDKTDGFLKHTHAFRKGDFSRQFLQMGVSELTMACIMNGMALHGGIIPCSAAISAWAWILAAVFSASAMMPALTASPYSRASCKIAAFSVSR